MPQAPIGSVLFKNLGEDHEGKKKRRGKKKKKSVRYCESLKLSSPTVLARIHP